MSHKFILEILKTAGLPGVILIGWVITAMTGKESYSNIMAWGVALTASVVINFLMFQLSSWRDSLVAGIRGVIDSSYLRTTEAVEMLVSLQQSLVKNMSILLDVQEGNLSLRQLQVFVNFICDTFKWRTWQVCLNAIDPAQLKLFSREDLQSTVEIQIHAILKQLSMYNKLMGRPDIQQIAGDTVNNIFSTLYEEDQMVHSDDYTQRIRTIMDCIRHEFDDCGRRIMGVIEEHGDATIG